jgi:hypothetical protein
MTVAELIEKLSKIENQDALVMTSGYEGGFDDIHKIHPEPIDIALNVNTEWYYGAHERASDVYQINDKDYQIVKAIIL